VWTEAPAVKLQGFYWGTAVQNKLLTIITVVYNGAEDLRKTIESVESNYGENIQFIVIDGGSTDGTVELIKRHENVVDCWISEPDHGIYDAMNKGIALSTGKYLLFLNAKDELVVNLDDIEGALSGDYVIVYGKANMMEDDRRIRYAKGKPLKSHRKLISGTPLCHQAIFYRRDLIGCYDLDYRILADRVLTHELVAKYGISKTLFLDLPIVNYFEGGFSRQNYELWKREEIQFLESLGENFLATYKKIAFFYKKYVKKQFRET
jgi:glycosyltransferase involved in cell wall biosynthesis